jgi:hypothetical protein
MECRTLIIGGGIAGLYLAEKLAKRGGILLLEKNNYLGGRIYTFRDKATGLQYEAGAGRIHRDHALIAALVRRFGLKTYSFSGDSEYAPVFGAIHDILTRLPPDALRRHTIAELLPRQHRGLLSLFPYWAETHMMRADVALGVFRTGKHAGVMADTAADAFYGIAGGIDTLTARLAAAARTAGADVRTGHEVLDVVRMPSGHFQATVKTNTGRRIVVHAERVVFAVCRCGLSPFRILRDESFIRHLATSPLLRIYAVYPPSAETGRVWFAGDSKTVVAGPLRFVIPINPAKGLIMISYTDGADTEHWRSLEGPALQREIQRHVRAQWPDREIPEPTYLRKHYWGGGCTYWLPGDYDVESEAAHALNPQPGLYVCGESISAHQQAWIEGALETAEILAERL